MATEPSAGSPTRLSRTWSRMAPSPIGSAGATRSRSTMPTTPGTAAASWRPIFLAATFSTSPSTVRMPSAKSMRMGHLCRLTRGSRSRAARTRLRTSSLSAIESPAAGDTGGMGSGPRPAASGEPPLTPRTELPPLLAGARHRRGLGPLFPGLLGEAHRRADLQVLEARHQHAVAMKIDLPAVGGFDEAVSLFLEQLAYVTVRRLRVGFHVAPLAAHVVLKLPARGIESVSNSHVEVLVRLVIDDELRARHGQVDPHLEGPAFAVVLDRTLQDHLAPHDLVAKQLELACPVADFALERGRKRQVTAGDLQWQLHALFLLARMGAWQGGQRPHLTLPPRGRARSAARSRSPPRCSRRCPPSLPARSRPLSRPTAPPPSISRRAPRAARLPARDQRPPRGRSRRSAGGAVCGAPLRSAGSRPRRRRPAGKPPVAPRYRSARRRGSARGRGPRARGR